MVNFKLGTQVLIITKGTGKGVKCTDKEKFTLKMEISTKVTLNKVCNMEKVNSCMPMVTIMRETSIRT